MAIEFKLSDLTSRTIRADIGQRTIRALETNNGIGSNSGGTGGIIGFFLNGLDSLGGFILSGIGKFFAFSWTTFWSWFVATKQFIWNFNWNISDAQLNQQIQSQYTALAAQLGGTIGNFFGYVACGIVPGALIYVFNEPLGTFVLERIAEELIEEFLSNLGALLNSALILGTQILFSETYKSVRKLIKSNSNLVKRVFGEKAERAVKAWGEQGSQPWSLALAFENFLDNSFGEDGALREFSEELAEEADEACIEAGYVVASAVDSYLAQEMVTKKKFPLLGTSRYVEITPNRSVPEEKIVLGGQEQLLKPLIMQSLTTEQQFRGRDLGLIYGTPSEEMPNRKHRPEVVLKLYRKQNSNPNKGAIIDGLEMKISFRLMDKTARDFETDAYLNVLAQNIYREFATPAFKVMKGKQTFTYADFDKGYQFKLDVDSQVTAVRIIKKVLDIQGHKMDDSRLRKGSTPVEAPSTLGEKVIIRGKESRLPVRGKEGEVSFIYAYLNTGIQVPPINLVDLTGRRKNVVYRG